MGGTDDSDESEGVESINSVMEKKNDLPNDQATVIPRVKVRFPNRILGYCSQTQAMEGYSIQINLKQKRRCQITGNDAANVFTYA